ncbi:MAG: L,D-transpeptidase [Caldilineaceae bacterium]|nr:L,D-transpeptidase [Caldilineaceae bacterium]
MVRKYLLVSLCVLLLWTMLPAPGVSAVESDNGVILDGNGVVSGKVTLQGVARHPAFRKWQLDLLPQGDAHSANFLALGEEPKNEVGVLTTIDTTLFPDGDHLLRLRVVHSNLNYEEYFTPITIANQGASPALSRPSTVDPSPAAPVSAPAPVAAAAADPNGLQLGNAALQGTVTVRGVATHPAFRKWQVDLLIDRDPAQAHFVALGEKALPTAGVLTDLNTRLYPDGEHLLRLRVVHSNLNYEEYYTPITVRNGNARAQVEAIVDQPALPAITGMDLSNAPADGVRRIEINVTEQTLTAYQGDVVVMHTSVSTGRPATPTVLGRYTIRTKIPSQRMRGPGYDLPNVPSVMYFYAAYAIHGAYWHNNFGQTMSHGCVNMRLDEAAALYEWASIGTEVYVYR